MGREELIRDVDNGLCLGAMYLSSGEGIKSKARDRGKGQREILATSGHRSDSDVLKIESNSRPAGIMWFWNAEREDKVVVSTCRSVLWDWRS